MAKTTGRTEPEPRGPAPRRAVTGAPQESAGGGAAAAEARAAAQTQLKSFEQAVRLFHSRKFADARELFVKAAGGPNREMAHNADLHIRMCDSRLEKPDLELRTAEDHYNYGVAMINTRNLAAAQQHLESALKIEPGADHIHYALALAKGLAGDIEGAYENLKRAIDLEPRNRIAARQDADFAAIANDPPIHQLLFPDKTGAT